MCMVGEKIEGRADGNFLTFTVSTLGSSSQVRIW